MTGVKPILVCLADVEPKTHRVVMAWSDSARQSDDNSWRSGLGKKFCITGHRSPHLDGYAVAGFAKYAEPRRIGDSDICGR